MSKGLIWVFYDGEPPLSWDQIQAQVGGLFVCAYRIAKVARDYTILEGCRPNAIFLMCPVPEWLEERLPVYCAINDAPVVRIYE